MILFERVSTLMTADLSHVDCAEDPGMAIGLLREMEASNVDVRREVVSAIVRVRQLESQVADGSGFAPGEAQAALSRELADARRIKSRLLRDMLRLDQRVAYLRQRIVHAGRGPQAGAPGCRAEPDGFQSPALSPPP